MYVIHDSISGAEWVVDGETNSGSEWSAVWNEKRVKDANTGSIASLQELENTLVERVLAQVCDNQCPSTHGMCPWLV